MPSSLSASLAKWLRFARNVEFTGHPLTRRSLRSLSNAGRHFLAWPLAGDFQFAQYFAESVQPRCRILVEETAHLARSEQQMRSHCTLI